MTSSTPVCATASARAGQDPQGPALLEIRDLVIRDGQGQPLVDGLSLSIAPGEALAVVGESGCGKSLTSLAVMGLLPPKLARARQGSIRFEGQDLAALPERALRRLRGNRMSMVFQEPLTALNPLMTIGAQIIEVLRAHRKISRAAARARAVELLALVRLPDPERRLDDYPHRLSGGQRQRVTIAMAIACDPALIIADEPTTALDVTVQAQILALLAEIRARTGQSLMLITHDLGVVGQVADRMVVVYAGVVVEDGPVAEVLRSPRHPYTAGLMAARPQGSYATTGARVADIAGAVPAPSARPAGCLFAPRCDRASPRCQTERPRLQPAQAPQPAASQPAASAPPRTCACFHPLES